MTSWKPQYRSHRIHRSMPPHIFVAEDLCTGSSCSRPCYSNCWDKWLVNLPWLVVWTPVKDMNSSVGMIRNPIYGTTIKDVGVNNKSTSIYGTNQYMEQTTSASPGVNYATCVGWAKENGRCHGWYWCHQPWLESSRIDTVAIAGKIVEPNGTRLRISFAFRMNRWQYGHVYQTPH